MLIYTVVVNYSNDHISAFMNFKKFLKFKVSFITVDFWSAYRHDPIKNENKNLDFWSGFLITKMDLHLCSGVFKNEERTRKKNKNAIFVFVFDVPILVHLRIFLIYEYLEDAIR